MQKTQQKPLSPLPCQGTEHVDCTVSLAASSAKHVDRPVPLSLPERDSVRNVTPHWSIWDAADHRTFREVLAFIQHHEMDQHGFVYFIRDHRGLIKIGFSKQPRGRVSEIQYKAELSLGTGESLRHDLLGFMPGDKDAESYLHEAFLDSSVGNEWFRSTPALEQLITEVSQWQRANPDRYPRKTDRGWLTHCPAGAQTVIGGAR